EYDFMFVTHQDILDIAEKEMITLRNKELDAGYQYMVRRWKKAKDPAKDKFDFRLVFSIKYIGERVDKVPIYLWGKWDHTLKLAWAEKKKHNFKKVNKIWIFPDPMDYAERRRWRQEHRKWADATNEGQNSEAFKLS